MLESVRNQLFYFGQLSSSYVGALAADSETGGLTFCLRLSSISQSMLDAALKRIISLHKPTSLKNPEMCSSMTLCKRLSFCNIDSGVVRARCASLFVKHNVVGQGMCEKCSKQSCCTRRGRSLWKVSARLPQLRSP